MTNNTVYFDPAFSDDERRRRLYEGQLFVYGPRPSTLALCKLAQGLIEEAFAPLDAESAQRELPVERYAEILGKLKPTFIHHPDSKRHIKDMLGELGCDLERTYFDVPRMRSSTSDNYLTTGIAYAFHPHRDTWYSAPMAQLNFWIPIFPVVPSNVMAFHPKYFDQPVKNGSWEYNYAEWNATSRQDAAKHIGTDTRKQPHAEEDVELDPQVRIITKPGGILNFSGSQFHSSVPNTSGKTRWSIDFRTVNRQDVESGRGAPNVDCDCTGTTLGDFLRLTDYEHLPAELIARHDLPSIPAPAPRHDRVSPPAVAVG